MHPRNLVAGLAVSGLVFLTACPAQQQAEESASASSPALETDDDKAFYSLGYFVMKRASDFQLSERERQLVKAGAEDAIEGKEASVDVGQYQQRLASLFRERQSAGAEAEKLASQEWVDQQAAEPGAVQTSSGLVYIELEPGDGPKPADTDTVRVHYHGTLRDGTVFDSSRQRGTPAVFPLNRVIPCWTEALQRMSPGGKARVVCPSPIAYGDRGAPPHIQPGAALHFDVELLEIVEQ